MENESSFKINKQKMPIPDYLRPFLTPEQISGEHAISVEQVELAKRAYEQSQKGKK